MKVPEDSKVFAILSTIVGYSAFALGDAVFKHLSATYSVPQLIVMLGGFSFLVYLILSPFLGGLALTLRSRNKKLHIVRGFLVLGQVITIVYAFSQLPMVTVYALVFIAPAFTALLAMSLLGERTGLTRWLVILVGFLGVLVLLRPGGVPLEPASFATLFSAFCISLANILVRKMGKEETPLSFAFYSQLIILPMAVLAAGLFFPYVAPSATDWGWSVLGGILNAVGMLGLIFGFSRAPTASVAPFHYIQILWGVMLGYILFSDLPDFWTLVGAALIIASGIWLVRHERKSIPDLSGS